QTCTLPISIKDTESGSFYSAMNTPLRNGLTCHTSQCVKVVGVERSVGIRNPTHLSAARTVIRSGNIYAGTNEILLAQLGSIPASDAFQIRDTVLAGINLNASFGTAKRNIDHRTFISHQRS